MTPSTNDTPASVPTPAPTPISAPEAKPVTAQNPKQQRPYSPQNRPKPPREKPRDSGQKPQNLTVQDFPSGPSIRDLDMDIEAELAAAMEGFQSEMTADEEKPKTADAPGADGKLRGKIVSIHGPDVFVDVPNRRAQGVLPMMQFTPENPAKVGDIVEFSIASFDSSSGLLNLTMSGALAQKVDWSTVQKGIVVEARVMKTNKGGLEVEVNGIRGFMPFREIDIYRVENADSMIGQKLTCQVTEVDAADRNLVLSRRILLEKEREREREKFWAELAEGQTRSGIIRSIKPFGVFVDLGGADGMIPISELSWARVEKPEDIVQLNQKVEVKVIRLNPEEQKISLSLKQLANSPWDTINQRFPVGTIVSGKVTRMMDFGAFVELEPGVEGLIHISELGTNRVRRVRDAVAEGQEVAAQILSIDKENRRISLSLRALAVAQEKKETEEALAVLKARQEAEDNDDAPPPPAKKRNYDLKGGL